MPEVPAGRRGRGTPSAHHGRMSLSHEIHRHQAIHIEHEPFCDRCGHGASLHTLSDSTPCIGCGERSAAGLTGRPVCLGFASDWFDNSRGRKLAHA